MRRRNDHENSLGWYGRWETGRLKVGYQVWCHRHDRFGDRWVIHPSVVWDRKDPA